MKNTIAVLIYTYNEEKNIEDCIQSAKLLTNNIIVIDMESKDNTFAIAKSLGAEVFNFPFSYYVEPAREFGIQKAQTDWVFILDADERITDELREEIISLISQSQLNQFNQSKQITDSTDYRFNRFNRFVAYYIPRKNIFGRKKWLKHGGWWPDYQIRLINKKYFKNWPKEIHSTPVIEGQIGYLKQPLIHYFHGDFEEMVKKTITFENIEAGLLYEANRSVSTLIFFRKFSGELYRRLLKHTGFLDGTIGIMECIYQAFSKTITYLYLYEKKKSSALRSLP